MTLSENLNNASTPARPSMALRKTVYVGPVIQCKSLNELDVCLNGAIGVDEDGKIAWVTREQPVGLGEEWQEARWVYLGENEFFFPGFIDTHIHASQYPNAGVFGKSTLMDWLDTYTFPLESSFADLSVARRVYSRVVARTLSHGTTTAAYYATTHVPATNLLASICLQRGQRALVGRVCMDRLSPPTYRDESPAASLAATKSCIAHIRALDPTSSLITPIITPRFAPSCTAETLSALGALAREEDLPTQTHISENASEIALVRELFPSHPSYAAVYDAHGLLTPRSILAHAVHLSADERALLKARGAKVSHCPASNAALTSGRLRARQLLDEGIDVGLGTDVSGGYTASVLAEAREAVLCSRHVAMEGDERAKLAVEEGLWLATRGGARVVGLEGRVGGFEVGMEWDAQLVRLGGVREDGELGVDGEEEDEGLVEVFGGESWDDKVAKWVYTGDDRNTVAVWVKGRLVHQRKGFGRVKVVEGVEK